MREANTIRFGSEDFTTVSVVILTYNRKEKLRDCLESIIASRPTPSEITVIDDASTDGTDLLMRSSYPQCRLIRHQRPQLTGVGINEGIRASTGDVVLIVDDDNVLAPDAIGEIASTFNSRPNVGVVGPICYYLSRPHTIMYAGARLSPITRRVVLLGHRQQDYGQFSEATRVEMFPNCFAVRRALLANKGLIDTWRLPFFNDDASLQLALRRRGYQVILNTKARTWHDYPFTMDEHRTWTDPFRIYYAVRSKIYLEKGYDTFLGRISFFFSYPGYMLGYIVRILSTPVPAERKRQCLHALRMAILDGLRGIGGSPWIK